MKIDKKLLKDKQGRPLTQSIFLETNYSDYAVYTFDDEDKMYKGKKYPSLKKLYLACGDPTEYAFAKEHLLNWSHWERLNANKALAKHFDIWRSELEIKIRSEAIGEIIYQSKNKDSIQAAKWLADKGWDKNAVGRPKKDTKKIDDEIQKSLDDEFGADFARLQAVN